MARLTHLLSRKGTPDVVLPADKEPHLGASLDRALAIATTNRALRRTGFWVGGIGTLIGLAGVVAAAAIAVRFEEPESIYIERDPRTGELSQAPRALKAAMSFTEGTIKQHLRMVLDDCDSYQYSTYNMNAARCQLFLTPTQRNLFAREVDQTNPDSLIARYGRDGSVSVADRVTYEQVAAARDGTQVWAMRYIKIFAKPGKAIECLPWTTVVTFQWRPDLRMAEEHRVINLGGMQISDRRSGPDPVRKPEC